MDNARGQISSTLIFFNNLLHEEQHWPEEKKKTHLKPINLTQN